MNKVAVVMISALLLVTAVAAFAPTASALVVKTPKACVYQQYVCIQEWEWLCTGSDCDSNMRYTP